MFPETGQDSPNKLGTLGGLRATSQCETQQQEHAGAILSDIGKLTGLIDENVSLMTERIAGAIPRSSSDKVTTPEPANLLQVLRYHRARLQQILDDTNRMRNALGL